MHNTFLHIVVKPIVPFIQNVLSEIPKLKHIIYVDQKMVSTEGFPAGLTMHSMQSVRQLGARPEKREYLTKGFDLWVAFHFHFFHISRDTDYTICKCVYRITALYSQPSVTLNFPISLIIIILSVRVLQECQHIFSKKGSNALILD